jgi:hypothetical protein
VRIDRLTQVTLVLITLFLGMIALRPSGGSPNVALAQTSLTGVVFTGTVGGFWLFDPRTGDAWVYDTVQNKTKHWRVIEPGKPLQEVK